jgi:hypothetical protein
MGCACSLPCLLGALSDLIWLPSKHGKMHRKTPEIQGENSGIYPKPNLVLIKNFLIFPMKSNLKIDLFIFF